MPILKINNKYIVDKENICIIGDNLDLDIYYPELTGKEPSIEEISESTVNVCDIFGDGSCIATYTFDGNANDLCGNYNGTWHGTEVYETGKFGKAAKFDGNSWIEFKNDANFYMNLQKYLSLWFNTNNISKEQVIIHIDQKDAGWTNFDLKIKRKNALNVKTLLKDSSVYISLNSIDAKSEIKTVNIKKYFVSNLSSKDIKAKILEVDDKTLGVSIALNGVTNTIPMNYEVKNGKVIAKGVIDARDFKLENSLKILNKNVAGHLNKGWLDISISFEIDTINKCI